MLANKTVLLGITGGIAAYKAVELLRLLTKSGADVHVIMTASACQFVTPLTFQTLSGNPVHTELFNLISEQEIGHIALSDRADLAIVAPTTANTIGKLANGICDDMLTTTLMATKAPVLIAPAMNTNMYSNPVYRDNENKLRSYGFHFVQPISGMLACGWEGEGKLAAVETIFETAINLLTPKDLATETVLITAGPTREAIDPVRYISNHSSGKMGYALALAALRRGAKVFLISGPVNLPPPVGAELITVESATEMQKAVMEHLPECTVAIKAAAVADYRVAIPKSQKIKKHDEQITLELIKNSDILATIGALQKHPFLVGFAAETDNLLENAKTKLFSKCADMIVANDVSSSDAGFNVDTNRATFLFQDGSIKEHNLMSKMELADLILSEIKIKLT